tara:strand:+ start:1087 stop:1419 length:333 start_codon:yes stop_codon:yes gene_type:complete
MFDMNKLFPPETLEKMKQVMLENPVPPRPSKKKETPKVKVKKIIGSFFALGVCEMDEDDCETLAKVVWLQKEGKEIFSEIPYKSRFIEFYYYDFADCHITPQSEMNGSDK